MVKVKFTAKPGLPERKGGRRWLHKKAAMEPYDEEGEPRTRLVEPVWFESGKTYEVTEWEAEVLTSVPPYNACFQVIQEIALPAPPPPQPEPSPEEGDA